MTKLVAGAAARSAAAKRGLPTSTPVDHHVVEISPKQAAVERAKRRRRILEAMRAAAPTVFCDPPKPLAVGASAQACALLDDTRASKGDIREVVRAWCSSQAYHEAVAAGGPRWNLDGSIADQVEPSHREHARERLRLIEGAP